MSSKAKKSSSVAASTSRASPRKSQTPQPQPSQEQAKGSPMSPTKYSRLHEKEELANLNNRLACYIDRVRNLEIENSRLTREVKTSQENVTREVSSVKQMYEGELSEARKLLDELSREKAKLQIDSRRLYSENEEIRRDLDQKSRELNKVSASLHSAEARLADLTSNQAQLQAERNKLHDEKKALEVERNRLAAQLAETRKLLEEETLQRVDMENSLQTLREDMTFKEQLHESQLTETRTRKQVEISEIDGRLTQEYEERLLQNLEEIREQYEADLEANKEEVKKLYEEKIRSLDSQLKRSSNAANMAISEMKAMQLKIDELNRRIQDLEAERNNAIQSARDLDRMYEQSKAKYIEEFSKQEAEINSLRNEMAQQVQEYQDLMDIKIALDMEIAAYRKLLEGEEARLNITPVSSPGRATPRKFLKGKRKRTYIEETSDETSDVSNFSVVSSTKCEVAISEVDPEGKFVKLTNKSNKEVALGGWQVIRQAGANTANYKFHRTFKLEPGVTTTIWSSDVTDKAHEPPENLLMKSQKWTVADSMTTKLVNPSGEEMASAEHVKQQVSERSIIRQREGSYAKRPYLTSGEQGEERCVVM